MAVVAMTTAKLIRKKRELRGFSVSALAAKIGVSESMLKKYECETCPIPADVANRAAETLKAPVIQKQYSYEHDIGIVPTPVMNNIDDHPVVVLSKMETELAEFLEAVRNGKQALINKQSGSELNPKDRQTIDSLMSEGIDVYTAFEVLAMVLGENYQQDVKGAGKRHEEKCRQRGYIKSGQQGKVIDLYPEPTLA